MTCYFQKIKTNLLSLTWSKGSQNAACWGSERLAEGWEHPGCKGQGTAGIKAHWTGYSPYWFSHWPPDPPSCCCWRCPSEAPGEETAEFKQTPEAKNEMPPWASMYLVRSSTSLLIITQQFLSCDFLLFLLLTQFN